MSKIMIPRLCSYAGPIFADLPMRELPSLIREDPEGPFGYTFQTNFHRAMCPYCSDKLEQEQVAIHTSGSAYILGLCTTCGWWALIYADGEDTNANHLSCGMCKTYSVSDLDVPIYDLRKYLANHPNDLAHTNPIAFERLVRDCLKAVYGDCDVFHIGGTGDGGIDLKLVENDNDVYLVQVKRRENLASKEGVQVVRELNGVLFREGKAKGIVVTTASGYTRAAIAETKVKTSPEEYEMKLLAFDDVVQMLRLPNPIPYEPWMNILEKSLENENWSAVDVSEGDQ